MIGYTSKNEAWHGLWSEKGQKTGDIHLEIQFFSPPPPPPKRKTLANGSQSTKEGQKKGSKVEGFTFEAYIKQMNEQRAKSNTSLDNIIAEEE